MFSRLHLYSGSECFIQQITCIQVPIMFQAFQRNNINTFGDSETFFRNTN